MQVYLTLACSVTFLLTSCVLIFFRIDTGFQVPWASLLSLFVVSFFPEFRRALFSFPASGKWSFFTSVSALLFFLSSAFFGYLVITEGPGQWVVFIVCFIFLAICIGGESRVAHISGANDQHGSIEAGSVKEVLHRTRRQAQESSHGKPILAHLILGLEGVLLLLVYLNTLLLVFFDIEPILYGVLMCIILIMSVVHEYYARYVATQYKRVKIDITPTNLLVISTLSLLLMVPIFIHSVTILGWRSGAIAIIMGIIFIFLVTLFSLYFRRGNMTTF